LNGPWTVDETPKLFNKLLVMVYC